MINFFTNPNYKALLLTLTTKKLIDRELEFANSLLEKDLLLYTKGIMQAVLELEKENISSNIPGLFLGKGPEVFYVSVIQLLLKKKGFPSEALIAQINEEMHFIEVEHGRYLEKAKSHAKSESKKHRWTSKHQKENFILQAEKKALGLNLHGLSKSLKSDIVLAFQLTLLPVMPAFDLISKELSLGDREHYMMSIFSTFCKAPLLIKLYAFCTHAKIKLFAQFFHIHEGKSSVATENKNLLEYLTVFLTLPEDKRKDITLVDVLTIPAYFNTAAYKKLTELCEKKFYIIENVDFVRFYHDYMSGEWNDKDDKNLKIALSRFIIDEPKKTHLFVLNLTSDLCDVLFEILNSPVIHKENLTLALGATYNEVVRILNENDALRQMEMKTLLTLVQSNDSMLDQKVKKSFFNSRDRNGMR